MPVTDTQHSSRTEAPSGVLSKLTRAFKLGKSVSHIFGGQFVTDFVPWMGSTEEVFKHRLTPTELPCYVHSIMKVMVSPLNLWRAIGPVSALSQPLSPLQHMLQELQNAGSLSSMRQQRAQLRQCCREA